MPTKAQVDSFLNARYDYHEIDSQPHQRGAAGKFENANVGYYYARGVKLGDDSKTARVDVFELIKVDDEWRAVGQVEDDGSVTSSPI